VFTLNGDTNSVMLELLAFETPTGQVVLPVSQAYERKTMLGKVVGRVTVTDVEDPGRFENPHCMMNPFGSFRKPAWLFPDVRYVTAFAN